MFRAVPVIFALLVAGCDDHYTTQEAYAVCDDLQGTSPNLNFESCVACHETCGANCQILGTSPETFTCEELGGAGGGQNP